LLDLILVYLIIALIILILNLLVVLIIIVVFIAILIIVIIDTIVGIILFSLRFIAQTGIFKEFSLFFFNLFISKTFAINQSHVFLFFLLFTNL